MESLLPSEIARLVLGYLEEEKCKDAARLFLETSPHLQECRTVTSSGRRFGTKVNGFTLAEILEKFCAANAIIHERLSKVADCEQLKHCGDLLEQLRFLVDGSRGQRFVVNINVPTTSQASGGSPIISSSMRKRRHSGSDRDRSKRAHKLHFHASDKMPEPVSSQLSCNTVDTTPLEHLPGHSGSEKMENSLEKHLGRSEEFPVISNCSSTIPEVTGVRSLTENPQSSVENVQTTLNSEIVKTSLDNREKSQETCSTATDTEELMHYTNTEVQTTPYDAAESETESAYEPVENLSLLTKELLNRTELQERIAENINKAILPSDASFRDVSLSESIGGEMNTSIMTELNNAIKSVVTATESDPIFAKFLDEIIGPDAENDESPDEDNDHQPFITEGLSSKPPDSLSKDSNPEVPTNFDELITEKTQTPEVPLKNRLRSSSNQQTMRIDDSVPIPDKLNMKDDVLEDFNAAAVLSIINVNSKMEEEKTKDITTSEILQPEMEEKMETIDEKVEIPEIPQSSAIESVETVKPPVTSTLLKPEVKNERTTRKTNVRKPRTVKQKTKIPEVVENLMSEEDIMAMPTLIVCSKEEISTIINSAPMITEPTSGGYCASQFLPIAPKTSEILALPPKPEPIYLRTVTVPTKISEIPTISGDSIHNLQSIQTLKPWPVIPHNDRTIEDNKNIAQRCDVIMPEVKNPDKITLYGNENSAVTVLDNSIVTSLNVDDTVSISGTGLSPFLKFNNESAKDIPGPSLPTINVEETTSQVASTSKDDNYDYITKRTPRSLLKSRSKNNRLSLSTPRRRSSHIRALDFNTPSKCMKTSRRLSANESYEYSPKNFEKKVCRTSLFKSPPFNASPKKLKSPLKDRGPCKIPIATRSPAPKLMGGWEKYTGVGMILGSTSPSSSSNSPVKCTTTKQTNGKSWDEDLRKSLLPCEETTTTSTTATTTTTTTTVETTTATSTRKIVAKKSTLMNKRQGRKKVIPNVSNDETSNDLETIHESEQFHGNVNYRTMKNSEETNENKNEEFEKLKTDAVSIEPKENSRLVPIEPKNNEMIAESPANVETLASNEVTTKSTKKKYAKLKTITTSVTKIERSSEFIGNASLIVEKIGEYSCTEKHGILNLPNMIELETPRKFDDTFGIPPTPRLLSPGSSNLTTPFAQIVDETTKVRSFVTTPDFPPTPSINLTPKQTNEDGTVKKDEVCSEYYEPSSEPKDPRTKRNSDHSRHDMSLPLPGMMMAIAAESRVKNLSVEVARGFEATTTSNRLEITQFEVIKENLPREEAFRELIISSRPNDMNQDENLTISMRENHEISQISSEDDARDTKDINNTSSTIDDSSDSDTSSSSDSSSSSSSSASSSSATNTSPNLTLPGSQSSRIFPDKVHAEASNDSLRKSADIQAIVVKIVQEPVAGDEDRIGNVENSDVITLRASIEENESSPTKVFPVVKNDEDLNDCMKETPAKDESLLSEAVISETPSSSKAGIETTNLNSKISALISSENQVVMNEETSLANKSVPRIVSVERILPNVSIAIKPPVASENLYNAMQCRNQLKVISESTLSKQLEEKRLRLMAKFKEKEKPSLHRPRIKRAVVIARSKKQTVDKDKCAAEEETEKMNEETEVKSSKLEEDDREMQGRDSTESNQREIEIGDAIMKGDEKKEVTRTKSSDEDDGKIAEEGKLDQNGGEDAMAKMTNDEKEKVTIEKNLHEENEQKSVTKNVAEEIRVKVARKETHKKSQKKHREHKNEKISDIPIETKSTKDEIKKEHSKKHDEEKDIDKGEARVRKLRRSRSIEKTRTKTETKCNETTKVQENKSRELLNENINEECPVGEEIFHHVIESTKKDRIKDGKESIVISTDKKNLAKSKVDLVKRDLFSDEESNDQRATRSRTRQTSDLHASDSVDSHNSLCSQSGKNNFLCADEDMPGVLECLDLVPAIKNDINEEDSSMLDTSRRHHAEYHFIYDKSVTTKRRKRKFSNSELEFPVEVELSDENYRKCPKLMKATAFEEIFNLTPPRKKRGTIKDVKSTQDKKKECAITKKVKTVFKGIEEKPLATSSPVYKIASSKIAGKTTKSPKKNHHQLTDGRKKNSTKNDNKQGDEHEKRHSKTRKRKASASKDSEQVDKKSRTTDPQLLLDKLDLDKFLTTVHGPA